MPVMAAVREAACRGGVKVGVWGGAGRQLCAAWWPCRGGGTAPCPWRYAAVWCGMVWYGAVWCPMPVAVIGGIELGSLGQGYCRLRRGGVPPHTKVDGEDQRRKHDHRPRLIWLNQPSAGWLRVAWC